MSLLERSRSGVHLTHAGERILEHARELVEHAERIREEAHALRGVKKGLLKIGSFGSSASLKLLPPAYQNVRGALPGGRASGQ